MPCPKMFLSQTKNLTAFSASSITFVLPQKPISQNANHIFGIPYFCLAQNVCDCQSLQIKEAIWIALVGLFVHVDIKY